MKTRTLVIVIVGIAIAGIAAVGLFIGRSLVGNTPNPPVIIVGGSIHGQIDKGLQDWNPLAQGWTQITKGQLYSFAATNNTSIYPVDVYDNAWKPLPQVIPVSGFVIAYYDSLADGATGQGTAGVEICSDKTCTGAAGDGTTVFMKITREPAQLEEKRPLGLLAIRELHFHSLDTNCDTSGSSGEGNCDIVHHITIQQGAGASPVCYHCGLNSQTQHGHCTIGIGGPPKK